MEQPTLLEMAGYPALPDDPERITELDICDDENGTNVGIWVQCEWGYDGCSRANYSAWMLWHDGGWMCPNCDATSAAEYDDWMWCAKYS